MFLCVRVCIYVTMKSSNTNGVSGAAVSYVSSLPRENNKRDSD